MPSWTRGWADWPVKRNARQARQSARPTRSSVPPRQPISVRSCRAIRLLPPDREPGRTCRADSCSALQVDGGCSERRLDEQDERRGQIASSRPCSGR